MPAKPANRPVFFDTPADFRAWLASYHSKAPELWVGFRKVATGMPSITWPESVDQALCFGWIDGLRKSVDADAYMIRFTPRRAGSTWSAVNIRRVAALTAAGLMQPAGLRAFEARIEEKSGIYSYETRPETLPEPYAAIMRKNRAAWKDFGQRSPSYRRGAIGWVISAKTEETRLRRLAILIDCSAKGDPIPQLDRRSVAKTYQRIGGIPLRPPDGSATPISLPVITGPEAHTISHTVSGRRRPPSPAGQTTSAATVAPVASRASPLPL